jgi:hypothetical protein
VASPNAVRTVTPGTALPPAPVSIARSEKIAKVKVEAKTAIASWSPRSSSKARTIRGENCPIASCTATSVTVSTSDVNVTTAVATVASTACASAALPTIPCGSNVSWKCRSTATVSVESAIPVAVPRTGITQSLRASACTRRKRTPHR